MPLLPRSSSKRSSRHPLMSPPPNRLPNRLLARKLRSRKLSQQTRCWRAQRQWTRGAKPAPLGPLLTRPSCASWSLFRTESLTASSCSTGCSQIRTGGRLKLSYSTPTVEASSRSQMRLRVAMASTRCTLFHTEMRPAFNWAPAGSPASRSPVTRWRFFSGRIRSAPMPTCCSTAVNSPARARAVSFSPPCRR